MKDLNLFILDTLFVNPLDLDEDQIPFYDQFIQKNMKFQKVHILFLATVFTYSHGEDIKKSGSKLIQ